MAQQDKFRLIRKLSVNVGGMLIFLTVQNCPAPAREQVYPILHKTGGKGDVEIMELSTGHDHMANVELNRSYDTSILQP